MSHSHSHSNHSHSHSHSHGDEGSNNVLNNLVNVASGINNTNKKKECDNCEDGVGCKTNKPQQVQARGVASSLASMYLSSIFSLFKNIFERNVFFNFSYRTYTCISIILLNPIYYCGFYCNLQSIFIVISIILFFINIFNVLIFRFLFTLLIH